MPTVSPYPDLIPPPPVAVPSPGEALMPVQSYSQSQVKAPPNLPPLNPPPGSDRGLVLPPLINMPEEKPSVGGVAKTVEKKDEGKGNNKPK